MPRANPKGMVMNILKHLRLRTKLVIVMAMAAIAVVASITMAAWMMRSRMVQDRVAELQAVVQSAVGLAQSLEDQVAAHQLSREQAQEQFRKAAHVIRFDHGQGYIYAQTLDNVFIVHGANPKLENTASKAADANGRSLTSLIAEALRNSDNGFITYTFARPGETQAQPKVAFVSRFRAWDLVFAAGAYTDDLDKAFRTTLLQLGATGGVIMFLAAAVCWLIARDISGSMVRLRSAMQRLARGDLTVSVAGTDRGDEVGEMAAALQVFKDNAVEMERLKAERQEAEKSAAEEKRNALRQLAGDFEAGIGEVVQTVASAATEMESTAASMSATAEQTSRQTAAVAAASEQASTNVQSVAAAVEELSSSVDEISRQVTTSSAIAAKAVGDAELTNALVTQLAGAAKKIGAVTEMISEIAGKTNLLALNATIEAARAGDAGKGFAVVASEVKGLANQTAHATHEISEQIAAMQNATAETVAAIQAIGATIGQLSEIGTTIASAVEEQSAATQEIARNFEQAAAGTTEVSSNIAGVTQAVNATGTAAGQVLGAAGELAKQGETLRRQVDRFLSAVRAA
jgi:methyl-accepting chemotaxis protein